MDRKTNIWFRGSKDKGHRYYQECERAKVGPGETHQPLPRQQVDSAHHQTGNLKGGKDHRGNQASGGGTILMNSGRTPTCIMSYSCFLNKNQIKSVS